MIRYVLLRLLQGIAALLLASIVVFGLARMTGNPLEVMLPNNATEAEYKAMAEYLGLDKPLPEQYLIFIRNSVKGDFGRSLRYRAPVTDFILAAAPVTIKLSGAAALVSLLIAVPAGVFASVRRNRMGDILARSAAVFYQSVPTFWLGIVLIQVFAVKFGLLPAGGYGGIQSWILPAITLGAHATAGIFRLTRSAMLDTLDTDYVRLARIKGAKERVVIWKHALRNALIPVVTFSSMIYVHMLIGAVVTETIFAWPGLGRLAYQSVMYRDFPMIQGLMLIFVCLFVVANLLIDISYCFLDPRVRYVKE